jgi:hypothetical protein
MKSDLELHQKALTVSEGVVRINYWEPHPNVPHDEDTVTLGVRSLYGAAVMTSAEARTIARMLLEAANVIDGISDLAVAAQLRAMADKLDPPPTDAQAVLKMWRSGLTERSIARATGCPLATVQRICAGGEL